MNLFGKKKTHDVPAVSPINTIKLLKDNLEMLEKREKHVELKVSTSLEEAKIKAKLNNKNAALFALKRKKMYEEELSKLQGSKITLESQIIALESAAINMETFKAINSASKTMKAIRGNIDEDTVNDIMDEIEEENDTHNMISEAISRPFNDMLNDADLLQELEDLENLEIEVNNLDSNDNALLANNVPNVPILPNAPINKINIPQLNKQTEEVELKKLADAMM